MINTNSFTSNLKSNLNYWFSNNRLSITSIILLIGLIAFEMFNYSTTDYALFDLLGDLEFAGIYWSTILAIAFCLIDFAGIARLFMPGHKIADIKEDWFLFGAWLLAATMNAILTWWGVSMSIVNHSTMSSSIVDQETIQFVVPIFVAIMVWVTRILLIGSLSLSNQKSFSGKQIHTSKNQVHQPVSNRSSSIGSTLTARNASFRTNNNYQPTPRQTRITSRPDPEYVSDLSGSVQQPVFQGKNKNNTSTRRF